MSRSRERELAEGARAGDASTLDHIASLLASEHAYTRGRASEWLATAPSDILLPRLLAGLQSPTRTLWWRVLALRSEAGTIDWADGGPVTGRFRRELESQLRTADPDARFFMVRALIPLPQVWVQPLLHEVTLDEDDEVALRAIGRAHTPQVLPQACRDRLRAIQGSLRTTAAWMGWLAHDASGEPDLMQALLKRSPWSMSILEVVEARRAHNWLPTLRACWSPRWKGRDPVGLRAASVAALLHDNEARAMLEDRARSWTRPVRWGAELELARLATPEERVALLLRLANTDPDRFAHHVQALAFASDGYVAELLQVLPRLNPEDSRQIGPLMEGLVQYRDLVEVQEAVQRVSSALSAHAEQEPWWSAFRAPPDPPWERAWSFSTVTATSTAAGTATSFPASSNAPSPPGSPD